MSWVQRITAENFQDSFHLPSILANSVFYPDAACDGSDIEWHADPFNSFVHSDEFVSEADVNDALLEDFTPVGYDLIGIQKINLAPFKFTLWAVYSLRSDARHYSNGRQKVETFSILHVCAPARIAFTYLYEVNDILPATCYEKTIL